MESSEKGVCEEGGSSCDGSSGVCEAGRGPSHTLLFSRNEDVDRLNERELRKLPGALSCVCWAGVILTVAWSCTRSPRK